MTDDGKLTYCIGCFKQLDGVNQYALFCDDCVNKAEHDINELLEKIRKEGL